MRFSADGGGGGGAQGGGAAQKLRTVNELQRQNALGTLAR